MLMDGVAVYSTQAIPSTRRQSDRHPIRCILEHTVEYSIQHMHIRAEGTANRCCTRTTTDDATDNLISNKT